MTLIGIDPGASGAISVLVPQEPLATSIPYGVRTHRFSSATDADTAAFFEHIAKEHAGSCFACLERVSAMPGQGVSSTFKFGQAYGMLQGLLLANKIPFSQVVPRSWQKHFGIAPAKSAGLSKTQHKNTLKAKAQELFPAEKIVLESADSLLIALYAGVEFNRIHPAA